MGVEFDGLMNLKIYLGSLKIEIGGFGTSHMFSTTLLCGAHRKLGRKSIKRLWPKFDKH